MSMPLIHDQSLINALLGMLPATQKNPNSNQYFSSITGGLASNQLSPSIKSKLSQIFLPNPVADRQYRELFEGDISKYNNDHSKADMALIGYFAREGLSALEADQAFRSSKLYREKWDVKRGPQNYGERTIGQVFSKRSSASAYLTPSFSMPLQPNPSTSSTTTSQYQAKLLPHSAYKPVYEPNGMAARKFVGPSVCIGTRLFPAKAVSALAALGGTGKTSVLLSIAAHIAAGKAWNGSPLQQQKVAMFFCEETQEEINRKFSATIDGWLKEEQSAAIDNLLTIPLLGVDGRLTSTNKGHYSETGFAEEVIQMLLELNFNDGLVIFDHLQGFTSGDLNQSETSTALSREANKIVDRLGVAVVFAAHISKNNINASEISQGFVVGSLAFENAVRQMSGMIHMSSEQAKKYGVEEFRKDYVWLGIPKNNYGNLDDGVWLQKNKSSKYHTVTFAPTKLIEPISPTKLNENQRLEAQIIAHLNKHPFTTKNMLDGHAGRDGVFRVSKEKLRDSLKGLLDSGLAIEHTVADLERNEHNLPRQVKTVLRSKSNMAAELVGRQ